MKINDLSVLMVIDNDDNLIHIGAPESFKKSTIAKYATSGFTIKTISFREWKELVGLGAELYRPLPQPPSSTK